MIKSEIVKLLNFDIHENRIWNTLQKGSWNITELASLTRFPRTTLYTAISSLKKRGLITTRKKGQSTMVTRAPQSDISDILTRSAALFRKDQNVQVYDKNQSSKNSGFTIIYGKKSLFRVWDDLAKKKDRRLYAIQSTRSLLNTIKKFKPGEFVETNNFIKKNKIVVEAILREDNLPAYMAFYKNNPRIQKKILESFLGRMADAVLVGNDYLNNNSDLLITSDSAFLMNWDDEVGIEIRNKDMIEFLKELFELAKGYGKKINYNEYIKDTMRSV